MTITRIIETVEKNTNNYLDEFEVTLSNWGNRVEIDNFKEIWEDKNFSSVAGGNVSLAYFEV
jgi:hypothetical protein